MGPHIMAWVAMDPYTIVWVVYVSIHHAMGIYWLTHHGMGMYIQDMDNYGTIRVYHHCMGSPRDDTTLGKDTGMDTRSPM